MATNKANIQQQTEGNEGLFYIENNTDRIGELRYTVAGNHKIEIYHTEISPEMRGENLGLQLVEAAVNYARKNHLKVIPSCTFAKAVFARHSEYHDVLA